MIQHKTEKISWKPFSFKKFVWFTFNKHLKNVYRKARFATYYWFCKMVSPKIVLDEKTQALVDTFKKDEALLLPQELPENFIEALHSTMKHIVENESAPEAVEKSNFSLTVKNSSQVFPLEQVISPRMEQIIQGYYGSNFKIIQTTCYRTLYTDKPADHSWLWHSDANLRELFKIMIYFTDTVESNGAFQYHPLWSTKEIYPQFHDRRNVGQIDHILNDPKRYRVAEGKKGTVVFFDNNLIHRGFIPKHPGEYRDALILFISPSHVNWRTHFNKKGKYLQGSQHWKNPFFV